MPALFKKQKDTVKIYIKIHRTHKSNTSIHDAFPEGTIYKPKDRFS